MKIFYQNLADTATVTASTADTNLPVANLANYLRKRLYRSGSEANTTIHLDFGAATTVSAVILLDVVSAGASALGVVISSSTNDSTWTSRATPSIDSYGTVSSVFAGISARYWRIVISRDDNAILTIGRLFLGAYYAATEQPDYDGATITPTDPSNTVVSAGGQEYTDIKEHYDLVDLKFTDSPNTQSLTFPTIFALMGKGVPFFVQIDTSAPFDKIYYVKFVKDPQRRVSAFDSEFKWSYTINLKEQL